jgi:hypothetical protein
MPLFLIYCVFLCVVHDTGIDVIHYCCMDGVGWKRQEVGLKRACRVSVVGIRGLRSKSVEELPSVPTGTRTYAPHIMRSSRVVIEVIASDCQ